jgi:Clathrin light chain
MISYYIDFDFYRNAEKENITTEPELEFGSEISWERVSKLCDFTQSSKTKASLKDNARMRNIILQLKQNPVEKA